MNSPLSLILLVAGSTLLICGALFDDPTVPRFGPPAIIAVSGVALIVLANLLVTRR